MQSNIKNSNVKVNGFLGEIIKKKNEDLSLNVRSSQSFRKFRSLSFRDAVTRDKRKNISLIAEIKFSSPTSKNLGSPDNLLPLAKEYEKAGADAISIITEKHFFNGDVSYVIKVKNEVNIPVLQKDFVIDSSQIYEAKKIGSDALLLITRLVAPERLEEFVNLCFSLEIEPVVEIASIEDLEKAVSTKTNIIAVNARDLETFVVDTVKAGELLQRISDSFIKLGFSGISSKEDVENYRNAGVTGVLVGTSLMNAENVKKFIDNLNL